MLQEAMKTLQEAEAAAKHMLEEAKLRAEQKTEDAKREGANRVTEAEQRAQMEIADLKRQVQQKAAETASSLVSNMENKKAAIGAKAESAMHKTVAFIVERIVSDEWRA